MRTFRLLVANSFVASMTNNYLWFALTFWAYLETKSVIATSIIGGGYMLLMAISGMAFGTYVDRHARKTSMLVSTTATLVLFSLAAAAYALAPGGSATELDHPAFWLLVTLTLAGAIAGNLRMVALSTTVTMLVPKEEHDKANGLVGTVNGLAFTVTSLFSGISIGFFGMGWTIAIGVGLTALALAHLATIDLPEERGSDHNEHAAQPTIDVKGAVAAVRKVPGLPALLVFSTFNNLLGGTFMALCDPYALELVSVEAWGTLLAISSIGFIVGGTLVATKGLGPQPVRALLLANVAMWTLCIIFPLRSSIVLLVGAFFFYMCLVPRAEAAEQTIIQGLVPFEEQGRVFGFAQSVETAASPVTSFLLGPLTQLWMIPLMTDGAGADAIGDWFGRGPDRGIAVVFVAAGVIGVVITLVALQSKPYRRLSDAFAANGTSAVPSAV